MAFGLQHGHGGPSYKGIINASSFIAGDGVADDSAGIRAAIAEAAKRQALLLFGPATCKVTPDVSNQFYFDLPSNIEVVGVRGLTVFQRQLGAGATPIPLFRIDNKDNVTLRNFVIDGAWNNALTTIAAGSDGAAASTGTWNVASTALFPSSGTLYLITPSGTQTITYNGTTATQFLNCTGGTGTLMRGYKIGYLDANTGIGHTTQADPRNHEVQVRGSRGILLDSLQWRRSYGDFAWIGYSSDSDTLNLSRDIVISRCRGDMSARNGITIGQKAEDIVIENTWLTNIFATAIDTEPQGPDQAARNVKIKSCKLGLWWNPNNVGRTVNSSLSITGGNPLAQGEENMARNYRVTDCDIEGAIAISAATDVVLYKNRIVCDFVGACWSPVNADHYCNEITIDDNEIYDRSPTNSAHLASINIEYEGSGSNVWQPTGVVVKNNRIRSLNGNKGIRVNGVGGQANAFTGGVRTWETNTATSTTATTLVRSGATWTVNQWVGWTARIGAVCGAIISNTATTLTLTGWYTPTGERAPTPAAGVYIISTPSGVVDVDNNTIDCTDDGYGKGSYGIDILADAGGGRIRARGNKLRNCDTYGIRVVAPTASTPIVHLEISDTIGWDDQATATFSHLIRFETPGYITKLVMRNNTPSGVTFPVSAVNGLSSATTPRAWIVSDGPAPIWEGYGTPEAGIVAPIGSRFYRLDSVAANTTEYIKESGVGNTGWIPK